MKKKERKGLAHKGCLFFAWHTCTITRGCFKLHVWARWRLGEKESAAQQQVCLCEKGRERDTSSAPPTSIQVQIAGEVKPFRVYCAAKWHYLVVWVRRRGLSTHLLQVMNLVFFLFLFDRLLIFFWSNENRLCWILMRSAWLSMVFIGSKYSLRAVIAL